MKTSFADARVERDIGPLACERRLRSEMGLFDFFRKRQERKKENGKRSAALIEEVRGWVSEDLENRADLVCIAAVTRTLAHVGVERAERQWRFMMTESEEEG